MKNSASKLVLLLCLALLVIADSVGKATTYSFSMEYRKLSENDIEKEETLPEGMLLEDIRSVDYSVLQKYAEAYGTDERLILAMIKQESQFDEKAVSYRGARGLMQLMPVTNRELRNELSIKGTAYTRENIQAGTYYFTKLYRLFKGASSQDRIRLALAAYNAGPSRIYDAQELAAYLGENPHQWSSIRHVLPLLSKRYYSLHRAVWDENRPPAGYYASWRETTTYVDAVMKTYNSYLASR